MFDADASIARLNAWLHQEGHECETLTQFVKSYVQLCRNELQLPLDRLFLGSRVLHPQVAAFFWTYERKNSGVHDNDGTAEDAYEETEDGCFKEGRIERDIFRTMHQALHPDEPLKRLARGDVERVRHQRCEPPWPPGTVTDLFQNRKYTDFYGKPVLYRKKFVIGITWATQHPDGFSDEHIRVWEETMPMLKLTLQLLLQQLITYCLLCAYLGSDPGTRVYHGSVHRGSGITTKGVVWFSDIRQFTQYSSQHSRDDVIELINSIFEITHDCIVRNGGEILKFMGDGTMALFTSSSETIEDTEGSEQDYDPTNNNTAREKWTIGTEFFQSSSPVGRRLSLPPVACGRALCQSAKQAAAELQHVALPALNERRKQRGQAPIEVGVGLHYGDCSYGNVGASDRLDFTVIGPSVNLASRVESLCSKLHARVLATHNFVSLDVDCLPVFYGNDEVDEKEDDVPQRGSSTNRCWIHRGAHPVKGVTDPVDVYELVIDSQQTDNPGLDKLQSAA